MNRTSHQSERAKARWAILREALLKNKSINQNDRNNTVETVSEHSINKFTGFQMLERLVIPVDKMTDEQKLLLVEGDYEAIDYKVPIDTKAVVPHDSATARDPLIRIRTKERKVNDTKLSFEELMSHVHYGVDNTGNTRVWDCSSVLTSVILGEKSAPMSSEGWDFLDETLEMSKNSPTIGLQDILSLSTSCSNPCGCGGTREVLSVLELGSGMAALPSLALAALEGKFSAEAWNSLPQIDVIITDGHPRAVENNVACKQLSQQIYNKIPANIQRDNIQCCKLLWKADIQGVKDCRLLMEMNLKSSNTSKEFDLLLGSDLTHFTDFHADLAVTIARLLRVGGVCILCQPCRGYSLKKFITLIGIMNDRDANNSNGSGPLFQVDLYRDYNRELTERHEQLSKEKHDNHYDPNIHYPFLLVLKKLRCYVEDIDTEKAVNYAKK